MKVRVLSILAVIVAFAVLVLAGTASTTVIAQTMPATMSASAGATMAAGGAGGVATSEPLPTQFGDDHKDGLLRIVHAAPGAPAVDVLLDGQPVVSGLAFGNAVGYKVIVGGNHHVTLQAAGKSVYEADFTLQPHTAMTAVAEGLMDAKDSRAFRLAFYNDDVSETNYRVRVTVIHAVPGDTANADDSNSADIVQVGGTSGSGLLYKALKYGQVAPGFVFDKGTIHLGVNAPSGQKTSVFDFTEPVDINTAYTAIITGYTGNPKTALQVIWLSVPGIRGYATAQPSNLASNPTMGGTMGATMAATGASGSSASAPSSATMAATAAK